jgi:hypothetical protein
MKNKYLYYLSVTMVMLLQQSAANAQDHYLQSEVVASGVEVFYQASNTIYSVTNAGFIVKSGGRAELKAGNRIELYPGFQVQSGGMLSATIEVKELTPPDDKTTVTVYPNPTEGMINVISPTPVDQARVVDLYGFNVIEQHTIGASEFSMDLTSVKPGIYILELTTGKTREQIRLEKK